MNTGEPCERTPLLNELPTIVRRSKIYLETILRLYYLRHGFDKSDMYMTHFLSYLAFLGFERLKALQRSDSASSLEELKEVQSTVILAAKGLHDQGENWYLAYTIFHMIWKEMGPDELEILHQYTSIRKDDLSTSKLRVRHVQCQYPVKIFNSADDPEHLRLEELVHRYADMVLEASGSDVSEAEST
ncbi:hypothetical protein BU23DRAFT_557964 [Bimuria novae-zelandiae CBS 107.79]|uniref:Uncharacterized protein n=1 Tax=Bimuria novae-zelandiae CBS 107.79 TaxID=1447943 RepID=A0A6A5V258_9PLEO|nr:hypothetical protein BU23DRAFT_557964 [Bimuria novae-zelandiae CBS 107.79]